jgi:hypothetical protein
MVSLTIMNLVTPKAVAKHDLLFNKPASGGIVGFVEKPSQTQVAHQSVTKIMSPMIGNFVTPKAAARRWFSE